MTLRKSCLVMAMLLPVTGCGWLTGDDGLFRDRGDDYRKAAVEPPIAIP